MKKKLILITLICTLILLVGCAGVIEATKENTETTKEVNNDQFETLSVERLKTMKGYSTSDFITIIKHKETGKRYIIYDGIKSNSITPLD